MEGVLAVLFESVITVNIVPVR